MCVGHWVRKSKSQGCPCSDPAKRVAAGQSLALAFSDPWSSDGRSRSGHWGEPRSVAIPRSGLRSDRWRLPNAHCVPTIPHIYMHRQRAGSRCSSSHSHSAKGEGSPTCTIAWKAFTYLLMSGFLGLCGRGQGLIAPSWMLHNCLVLPRRCTLDERKLRCACGMVGTALPPMCGHVGSNPVS